MGEGDGEDGSCLVGEESGKITAGLMEETREEEGACLVGEEGEREAGLGGDDGEGQETGVEGVV